MVVQYKVVVCGGVLDTVWGVIVECLTQCLGGGRDCDVVVQYKEPKRVVECLKKCGRIASQCMEKNVQVQLLVELVNTYALFFEKGNSEVRVQELNSCTNLPIFSPIEPIIVA